MSTKGASYPEPIEARHEQSARRLVLTWADDHVSTYPIDYLRSWCPCASRARATNRWPNTSNLTDQKLVSHRRRGQLRPGPQLGRRPQHRHLFSFRLLRQLCPCESLRWGEALGNRGLPRLEWLGRGRWRGLGEFSSMKRQVAPSFSLSLGGYPPQTPRPSRVRQDSGCQGFRLPSWSRKPRSLTMLRATPCRSTTPASHPHFPMLAKESGADSAPVLPELREKRPQVTRALGGGLRGKPGASASSAGSAPANPAAAKGASPSVFCFPLSPFAPPRWAERPTVSG